MLRVALIGAVATLLTTISARAATIVYTGSQQVGSVSATYSITTDGSTGVLTSANVSDYSISLASGGYSSILTPQNSGVRWSFTASTAALSINGNHQEFQVNANFAPNAPPVSVGFSDFLLFDATFTQAGKAYGSLSNGVAPATNANNTAGFAFSQSAATPAVPEPATWAMMLVGFGIVAGVSRRRRNAAKITYA